MKLCGAIFAEVAVLQLTVTEKADLFAADAAIFLVKQSHMF